ncbi:MAG: hypothetical protein ACOCQ5_03870 [Halanaerobiales bacterium]
MIHKRMEIWQREMEKNDEINTPVMDTYVLKGNQKRGAVLICPGGGYEFTSEREAEPIAMRFNAAGFHAFVLPTFIWHTLKDIFLVFFC